MRLWLVASFVVFSGFRLDGEPQQQHAVAADDPDMVADEVAKLVQMCVSLSFSL